MIYYSTTLLFEIFKSTPVPQFGGSGVKLL